jgi:hypothetical protein
MYYAGQKILAVIVCQFKKTICNQYFIVIIITVLIMNVIFWMVNFKTQNYFVISTTQSVYVRLSMYDCSNFVYSFRSDNYMYIKSYACAMYRIKDFSTYFSLVFSSFSLKVVKVWCSYKFCDKSASRHDTHFIALIFFTKYPQT